MLGRSTLLAAVAAVVTAHPAAARQSRGFTTEDALDVRSVRVADVSDDGRWVAATIQTRRDRLGIDHLRFGDPTYVAPSHLELLVIDTETGRQRSLLDAPAQVRGMRWSPSGDRLAFFMRRGEGFGLFVYDVARDRTREVSLRTGKALSSASPLIWAPGGSSVYVELRPAGWAEEARDAFLEMTEGPVIVQDSRNDFLAWDRVSNIGDRAIPSLVELQSGTVRELLPETNVQGVAFSEDGSALTYTSVTPTKTAYERNEGTDFEVLRLTLSGDEPTSLMGPTQRRPSVTWSHSGDRFAFSERGNVFVRDVTADSARNLTEAHRVPISEDDTTKLSFSVERWSADDGRMLVTSQRGWYVLDPDDGALRQVLQLEEDEDARPRRSIEQWSRDGGTIYFAYSAPDHWERGLERLDVQSGRVEPIILDANLYGSWNVSEDGGTIVYEMSDGDRPNDVWAMKQGAEPSRLTRANPQLADVALTRSELVRYLDVDGNELYGVLYYPVDYQPGQRYPLVAEIYEDFFDNGYNESMDLITAQGWFGFRPSVDLEIGYPGEAWLKGVTAGINKLIDDGLVDGDRLGVYGTSYGGYATNLLITQTNRFAAAVNISGKVDIISFLGDSPKITTRNYRAAEIGQDRIGATLWEQPQKYIQHSAVMFADRIETPLLMLTGEGDWNVPATNEREMYYALRRLGKEAVWVHYMHAGHGAGRAGTVSDFQDHWARMISWFDEHFEKVDAKTTTDGGR